MSIRHNLPTLHQRGSGLVDVLDRVLDKGLVVAGDIKISLAEVELLTIRIRLIVCSMDKAQAMGLDWWKHDPHLSSATSVANQTETEALRAQVLRLEKRLAALTAPPRPPRATAPRATASRRRSGHAR